ncbi:MAG: hypothetical protein LBQ12_16160 [Deltaproteobacteria bacterium]|nr:hypothetical protein [Deltaproteobacteria bacterium]
MDGGKVEPPDGKERWDLARELEKAEAGDRFLDSAEEINKSMGESIEFKKLKLTCLDLQISEFQKCKSVVQRHSAGKSRAEICAELNLEKSEVARILEDYGLGE